MTHEPLHVLSSGFFVVRGTAVTVEVTLRSTEVGVVVASSRRVPEPFNITSSLGGSFSPNKSLATQHLKSGLQRPSTFKTASQ